MAPPLTSAGPGEPDTGRQIGLPHSRCRPRTRFAWGWFGAAKQLLRDGEHERTSCSHWRGCRGPRPLVFEAAAPYRSRQLLQTKRIARSNFYGLIRSFRFSLLQQRTTASSPLCSPSFFQDKMADPATYTATQPSMPSHACC
jgi:hypothetical protein